MPTDDLLRRIKIKIFGASSSGKSTLIDSMKCSYINSFFRKSRLSNTTKPPAPKYKKSNLTAFFKSPQKPVSELTNPFKTLSKKSSTTTASQSLA
jgi:hypothetical protein